MGDFGQDCYDLQIRVRIRVILLISARIVFILAKFFGILMSLGRIFVISNRIFMILMIWARILVILYCGAYHRELRPQLQRQHHISPLFWGHVDFGLQPGFRVHVPVRPSMPNHGKGGRSGTLTRFAVSAAWPICRGVGRACETRDG